MQISETPIQGISEVLKCKTLRLRTRERIEVRNRILRSKTIQQLDTYETPSFP